MVRSYFQYFDNNKDARRMWKEQMMQEAIIQLGPERLQALMIELDGRRDGALEAVISSNVVNEKIEPAPLEHWNVGP